MSSPARVGWISWSFPERLAAPILTRNATSGSSIHGWPGRVSLKMLLYARIVSPFRSSSEKPSSRSAVSIESVMLSRTKERYASFVT